MTTVVERDLEERLDELGAQVALLVDEATEQRRRREARDELWHDLTPVARQLISSMTDQLDGAQLSTQDLIALGVRLGRSASTLEQGLERLDEVTELATDLSDLGRDMTMTVLARLDELERRGYFAFAAGILDVVDRVVTSFGPDDLEQLGDNVVLILETLKEMTQPDVMRMLRHTVHAVRADDEPDKLSMFRLLRELRDPEVKLGMHRLLTVMRGLAATPTDAATDDSNIERSE